jgi:hypothetical protein
MTNDDRRRERSRSRERDNPYGPPSGYNVGMQQPDVSNVHPLSSNIPLESVDMDLPIAIYYQNH